MSKVDNFIDACKANCGQWVCSLHTTGSSQPAAIFREAKKLGYNFEEVSVNRWAKTMYCENCRQQTTHYKLLSPAPEFEVKTRIIISPATRRRILRILGENDAFTGASISSVPEIDHKVPWTRLEKDIDASQLSDEEIKHHFQLLTREHNLLKDRACDYCKKNLIRPPFLKIPYWYDGDEKYDNKCEGCRWYDGNKWRESLSLYLQKVKRK